MSLLLLRMQETRKTSRRFRQLKQVVVMSRKQVVHVSFVHLMRSGWTDGMFASQHCEFPLTQVDRPNYAYLFYFKTCNMHGGGENKK